MKTFTLKLIFLTLISSSGLLCAQNVHIPDANFKLALVSNLSINTNADGEIQLSEAQAFTGQINVNNNNISDLTGIEAFISLTDLRCASNNLASLDVSMNTSLTNLFCVSNQLTSLVIGTNSNLEGIGAGFNNLTQIDLSGNSALTLVDFQNNQLASLNIQNGNNINFISFNVSNNPDLGCIQVDDVAYSEANWTDIDANAGFSTDCDVIDIPDSNFRQALTENLSLNVNEDGFIQVSEATGYEGQINVANRGIQDLSGIEAFTGIKGLDCGGNNLTSLNLETATSLLTIDCSANQLTSLDISNQTGLLELKCQENMLNSIDLSNNSLLTLLWVSRNELLALEVSDNMQLTQLLCHENSLTTLDLTSNMELEQLYCAGNVLTGLDLSNNPDLTYLSCGANLLQELNLSQNLQLEQLDAQLGELQNIVFGENPNLRFVFLSHNKISSINLSGVSNLQTLYIDNNELTAIDLSQLPSLDWLQLEHNQLTSLDISANNLLRVIICNDNNLSALNIQNGNNENFFQIAGTLFLNGTGNPNLNCVQVDNAVFSEENWNTDHFDNSVSYSLDCDVINLPDVNFSAAVIADASINLDGDNFIQKTEAAAFTGTMNVSSEGIADLSGIENFPQLTGLTCSGNQLTTIDLTSNPELMELRCNDNMLSSINLSANSKLNQVFLNNNQLHSLDVSANLLLIDLFAWENQIGQLDVSANSHLIALNLSNNALTSLNVQNGNNENIMAMNVTGNDLDCIQVDNVSYSEANWMEIDAGVEFATECNVTPQIVVSHTAEITTLDTFDFGRFTKGQSITNYFIITNTGDADLHLTGDPIVTVSNPDASFSIASFPAVTALKSGESTSFGVNVSPTTEGILFAQVSIPTNDPEINPFTFQLKALSFEPSSCDVPAGTMEAFYYASLPKTDLLSGVTSGINTYMVPGGWSPLLSLFTGIFGSDINIRSTDDAHSGDQALELINNENGFGDIYTQFPCDLENATLKGYYKFTGAETDSAIVAVSTGGNGYRTASNSDTLFIRQNTSEYTAFSLSFSFDQNSVDSLLIYLATTSNSNTSFKTDDLEIVWEDINSSPIVDIPDPNFKAHLVADLININTNGDDEIQVSEAEALQGDLDVSGKNIVDLAGIASFTNITGLNCSNNQLTSLDISENKRIWSLECSDNLLITLNASNGNNTNFLSFDATNNPELDCIEVDDADFSKANWINIDAGASFSADCSNLVVELTVDESKAKNLMQLYPNPVQNYLKIKTDKIGELLIEVYDLAGTPMLHAIIPEQGLLDVSHLMVGVYLVTVRDHRGTYLRTLKFIKQ